MSMKTKLASIKKEKEDKLMFSYRVLDGITTVWMDKDYFIQFKEENFTDHDVDCTVDDISSILKNVKVKDLPLKVTEEGTGYKFLVNGKEKYIEKNIEMPVPDIGSFITDSEKIQDFSVKDDFLDVIKRLDKQTITMDLFRPLRYIHCISGTLCVCNLVSITRYIGYLQDVSFFQDDFCFSGVHCKTIELFKKKKYQVEEFKDYLVFSQDDIYVILRKMPVSSMFLSIPNFEDPENQGDSMNVSWFIAEKDANKLIKETLPTSDKAIVASVMQNDKGELMVGDSVIGVCSSEKFGGVSLKDCEDGFDSAWYCNDKYLYYKYLDNYYRIFKV